MTLKISLEDLRTRVEARRRAKADALRARGVAVLAEQPRPNYSKIIPAAIARVLPWRRSERE